MKLPKLTQTLRAVATKLGVEIQLEQMTLKNGTIIEADAFEVGEPVFILAEDGTQISLPVGDDYEMEDGRVLSVVEEGIIATIIEAEAEAEAETEVEVEAKAEPAPEFVTKADFESAISEIKSLFAKQENPEVKKKAAVELAKEVVMPAAKPIKANPEKKAESNKVFYSQNAPSTLKSRVMAQISKI